MGARPVRHSLSHIAPRSYRRCLQECRVEDPRTPDLGCAAVLEATRLPEGAKWPAPAAPPGTIWILRPFGTPMVCFPEGVNDRPQNARMAEMLLLRQPYRERDSWPDPSRGTDPVAGEGEDEQGPERRLTIGSRRHDHVVNHRMVSISLR